MIVAFVYALGVMMLLADGAPVYKDTEASLETALLDEPSSPPDSLNLVEGRENKTKVAQVCSW